MATQLFAYTANTGNDAGAINSLGGVQTTGVIGFSSSGGTIAGNSTGLPYSSFPFDRYVQSAGPANGQTVVDVVFPRGRDNIAASYVVVYAMAGGVLT